MDAVGQKRVCVCVLLRKGKKKKKEGADIGRETDKKRQSKCYNAAKTRTRWTSDTRNAPWKNKALAGDKNVSISDRVAIEKVGFKSKSVRC